MIRTAMINAAHSKSDPNEHQITLTVHCQKVDSLPVLGILHDAIVKLGDYDPELKTGDMLILKDHENVHPLVAPAKGGTKAN